MALEHRKHSFPVSLRSIFVVELPLREDEAMMGVRIPLDTVVNAGFCQIGIKRLDHFRWRPVIGFGTPYVKFPGDIFREQVWRVSFLRE